MAPDSEPGATNLNSMPPQKNLAKSRHMPERFFENVNISQNADIARIFFVI